MRRPAEEECDEQMSHSRLPFFVSIVSASLALHWFMVPPQWQWLWSSFASTWSWLAGNGGGGGCEFSSYACLYSLNPTSIREWIRASQGEEVKQIQLFFVPFFFTFDSSGAKQNFGGASQRNKYVYLYKLVFYYKSKELACGLPCAAAAAAP